jgi:catechol 2,3-dioxygenase-like lactoylglutathione lyase family enzyme
MLNQIQGLHHVTSMASDARANNAFFTDTLGLRRVKKTVNFDAPDVYHRRIDRIDVIQGVRRVGAVDGAVGAVGVSTERLRFEEIVVLEPEPEIVFLGWVDVNGHCVLALIRGLRAGLDEVVGSL